MDHVRKYLMFSFTIFIVFQNCGNKTQFNGNCDSTKLYFLLDDVLKKRYLFPLISSFNDEDSSMIYNYLYLKGLPSRNEMYLQVSIAGNKDKIDSIRLIPLDTLRKTSTNRVKIVIRESNKDSTKINLIVNYSTHKYLLTEATFNYSFDSLKCAWVVLDSTFWEY